MLSFFTFAVLAIAAQSLFTGVDAAVLPKRQSISLPTQEVGNSLGSIIQSVTATFGGIVGVTGPLIVTVTTGVGDQLGALQQVIPVAVEALAGPGSIVSLTGVPGQPPLSIGFDFAPANGIPPVGFNSTSILSQISGPFSDIVSGFLGISNITTFLISAPGAGGLFSTILNPNNALSDLNDTIPLSSIPNISIPGLPFPTSSPTALPFPTPSNIASDILGALPPIPPVLPPVLPLPSAISSIASGISETLPSIVLPTGPSVPPLPRQPDISILPLPTVIPLSTDISVGPLPTGISISVPAVPTPSLGTVL